MQIAPPIPLRRLPFGQPRLVPLVAALLGLLLLGGVGVLAYQRFFALTARLAHALRGCGVKPGDRVAVQVDKSPEALALYDSVLALGPVASLRRQ